MERARESRRRFLEMQDEKPNFVIAIDDSPEKIDRKLNYACKFPNFAWQENPTSLVSA